jgi:hypothetical protein
MVTVASDVSCLVTVATAAYFRVRTKTTVVFTVKYKNKQSEFWLVSNVLDRHNHHLLQHIHTSYCNEKLMHHI